MIGRQGSTRQRLGVAAALIIVVSVAGPDTSSAAPSNASVTGNVNGLPCNDLCKAYMAWSDRVMARFRPAVRSQKAQGAAVQRSAVVHKKPDRTVHRAPDTRRSDLDSFARILRPSDTAPQGADVPQVAVAAPSGAVEAIEEQLSPPAGIANARVADASRAADATPPTTPVSSSAPISATEETSTADDFATARDWLLTASLVLAVCVLFVLLYWERFGDSTQSANRMR